ncbi:hypothetical protein, partial [Salmonella sp. s55044]|uniref:hypothetical protein n=1 Tax=Salmonella sp. s55044 TaxID=3159677 RepID=UPI003980F5C1
EILLDSIKPNIPYEELKTDISRRLEHLHCEKLAVYFGLTPVETETILQDGEPGMMVLKILDERELIMPKKVLRLYEGLQASHLNKIARLVLEYTDQTTEKNIDRIQVGLGDTNQMSLQPQHEAGAVVVTKSTQSRNIQSLIKEGYEELNVKRALKISEGKINLGRRLLKLAKEDKEMLSVIPGCK